MTTTEAVMIQVRATGSDNHARVIGMKIRASCTMSPKDAAMRAAEKVFGRAAFAIECLREPGLCPRTPGLYRAKTVGMTWSNLARVLCREVK